MSEDTKALKSQITQGHMVIKQWTEDFDSGKSEEECAEFSINTEFLPCSNTVSNMAGISEWLHTNRRPQGALTVSKGGKTSQGKWT